MHGFGLFLISLAGVVQAQFILNDKSKSPRNFNTFKFMNQDINAYTEGEQDVNDVTTAATTTPQLAISSRPEFSQKDAQEKFSAQPYYEETNYQFVYGPELYREQSKPKSLSKVEEILPVKQLDVHDDSDIYSYINRLQDYYAESNEVCVPEKVIVEEKPEEVVVVKEVEQPEEVCDTKTITSTITSTYYMRPTPKVTEYTYTTVTVECETTPEPPVPKYGHKYNLPCDECHHPYYCDHCSPKYEKLNSVPEPTPNYKQKPSAPQYKLKQEQPYVIDKYVVENPYTHEKDIYYDVKPADNEKKQNPYYEQQQPYHEQNQQPYHEQTQQPNREQQQPYYEQPQLFYEQVQPYYDQPYIVGGYVEKQPYLDHELVSCDQCHYPQKCDHCPIYEQPILCDHCHYPQKCDHCSNYKPEPSPEKIPCDKCYSPNDCSYCTARFEKVERFSKEVESEETVLVPCEECSTPAYCDHRDKILNVIDMYDLYPSQEIECDKCTNSCDACNEESYKLYSARPKECEKEECEYFRSKPQLYECDLCYAPGCDRCIRGQQRPAERILDAQKKTNQAP